MKEPFVLFQVGGATYGARSASIQQIEMVQSITRVPNAPGFVEGVVSVRGQVIPVISLRKRFHLEPAPLDLRSRIIVFLLDNRSIGTLVDTCREFIQIDTGQISSPPSDLTGPGAEYLEGIVNLKDRLILLVNLPRLLNPEETAELTRRDRVDPASQPQQK